MLRKEVPLKSTSSERKPNAERFLLCNKEDAALEHCGVKNHSVFPR